LIAINPLTPFVNLLNFGKQLLDFIYPINCFEPKLEVDLGRLFVNTY
jgi:hypothetical protein